LITPGLTPSPSPSASLDEVRLYVRRNARKGVRCPCCMGMVKVHERRITPVMAQGLVLACRYVEDMAVPDGWLALGDFFEGMHARGAILGKRAGGDYAKLRFWGLIEPKARTRPDATRSGGGKWAVTGLGHDFVHGRSTVSETAYVCMNELVGSGERRVAVADVMPVGRYEDLMRPSLPWDKWGPPWRAS